MPSYTEPTTLEGWITATRPDALAYAQSLLRDHVRAEDILHDCYCRLLARAEVYDLPRDGRKLLFEAITNAFINHKTRTRSHLSLDHDANNLHGCIPDPSAQPGEREAMDRELADAIEAALEQLPAVQRQALERKSMGHSLQDIAMALGITATYAGVLIHRARQTMVRLLSSHLDHAESETPGDARGSTDQAVAISVSRSNNRCAG